MGTDGEDKPVGDDHSRACGCRTWTCTDAFSMAHGVAFGHHPGCPDRGEYHTETDLITELMTRLLAAESTAELWRNTYEQANATVQDLRRKLALAGVEGSPPPGGQGTIPALREQLRAAGVLAEAVRQARGQLAMIDQAAPYLRESLEAYECARKGLVW